MLSERLNQALNDEIGLEFSAHSQYLAMAVYFEQLSLDKLAQFFYDQAEEEKVHGLKILKYVSEVGGVVRIPTVPEPQHEFASAEEIGRLFYEQEEHVTNQFNNMMEMALDDRDYATNSFLQWFVDEQVEELATSSKLWDWFKMAGSNLLMVEMMMDGLLGLQDEAGAEA